MQANTKTKCAANARLIEEIASEMSDPAWQEGFRDGQAARCESAPDMGRGHRYALGWITGRFVSVPPSLSIN